MDFERAFSLLLESFRNEGVDCALIGGFALACCGHVRTTQDIDFLILKEDQAKLEGIMGKLGYKLIHESLDVSNYVSDENDLGRVDFLYAHRKYALKMLERSREQEILNGRYKVKVIIPEDLIGLKVQASSNDPRRYFQDLADIEAVMRTHKKTLDMGLIEEYFNLFERADELKQIMKRI